MTLTLIPADRAHVSAINHFINQILFAEKAINEQKEEEFYTEPEQVPEDFEIPGHIQLIDREEEDLDGQFDDP